MDDSSDGNDDKESDGVVMTMVQNFTVTILDEEEDHKVVVEVMEEDSVLGVMLLKKAQYHGQAQVIYFSM